MVADQTAGSVASSSNLATSRATLITAEFDLDGISLPMRSVA